VLFVIGTIFPTAPLSTVMSNRFGYRPVVMLGGFLISLGTITTAFTKTITEMYITMGVVAGKCTFCVSLYVGYIFWDPNCFITKYVKLMKVDLFSILNFALC